MHCIELPNHCRYDLMLQCWQYEAEDRPSFRSIVSSLTIMHDMDVETSL